MGQYTGVDGATYDMVELLAAQTHVWKYGLGFVHSMCLKCALELGIPDAIHNHGGPMTLNELLAAVAVQPLKADPLRRIMRVLVHSNFFELCKIPAGGEDEEEEVAYALNSASKHLLENHPLGLRRCILGLMEPGQFRTLGSLSSWFCNGDPTPYETAHGRSGWERLAGDPEYDLGFNATMASDSQMVAAIVLDKCKSIFEGLVSLVDVAGGTGTMAKAIAGAFPDMECTVMDLPHVVANLQGTKNLKLVAGDMFKKIPSANALMLKWIFHDWNDEDSLKILKNCREAIPGKEDGGKLIIIDMVVTSPRGDSKLRETQLLFDAGLMVGIGGKERSETEWAKLFADAGFSSYKMSPVLGLRSIIEVYP